MARTSQHKHSLFPAQPTPVGAHRHQDGVCQVGDALSPCLKYKERKGGDGGCASLTAMALVFFLQPQGPPGFLFYVLFSFTSHVCVCSAMCKYVTCQSVASPDKPSCPKLSVPDVPKPHAMPSAAAAHGEVFECTASPSCTLGLGCLSLCLLTA